MKGSVLEIKERLSKEMPVIECSEFRTSKLCLDCGRVAKFYNYGVTYCQERAHHRMANRDVVAAKKIGARYLAQKKGLNLGPWSRGVSAEEVEQGTHVSSVLKRVLTSYANGTYFSNTSLGPMSTEHISQRRSQRLLHTRSHVL